MVLDAVRAGLPLDRIAVVLPDPEQVVVLREHFDRAQLPATWLVGPPLSTTPAARLPVVLLGDRCRWRDSALVVRAPTLARPSSG